MRWNTMVVFAAVMASLPAFAQEAGAAASTDWQSVGAAVALGIAALGGALGQGKIGAAAMDGIARNPQAQNTIFTPMLIALVFVETLVLFAFVSALI